MSFQIQSPGGNPFAAQTGESCLLEASRLESMLNPAMHSRRQTSIRKGPAAVETSRCTFSSGIRTGSRLCKRYSEQRISATSTRGLLPTSISVRSRSHAAAGLPNGTA